MSGVGDLDQDFGGGVARDLTLCSHCGPNSVASHPTPWLLFISGRKLPLAPLGELCHGASDLDWDCDGATD